MSEEGAVIVRGDERLKIEAYPIKDDIQVIALPALGRRLLDEDRT